MTEWNGARWWKFDFHCHTPASGDYGNSNLTPREWLLHYMKAGIDCVAVTDHNTGGWIDTLKAELESLEAEKPEGLRKLHLFPGVEISVHCGIHLLAVFHPFKGTSDLEHLLGAVGYQGAPGESSEVTSKSFVDVVDAVVSADGIAIPAHVDGDNGLFGQSGPTLGQALDCQRLFAMEMMNPGSQKAQLYTDKKLNWTEVLGSDSHHPTGDPGQRFPGSHFTWVKMGNPDIEGLRLALFDGSLSVRRSDLENGDPNEHAPLTLESMEVSEARYMGRSEPFRIGFNPWLNAVIGGRGTGKSTTVEFLRIAMRREDELPYDLVQEFEKYREVYRNRSDADLLTDNAAIRVICQKDRSRFRIQWNPAGNLEPIEQEVDGDWQPAEGDIPQRFPVRIYSQKQIFQLAKTPLGLLRVVDEAQKVDRRSWNERWSAKEAAFLSLRAKAREMETHLADEPGLRGELDDVERKLAVFEEAGHADILKTFQKRSRQQRTVEAWETSWIHTGDQLRKAASEILPDLLDETNFDSESEEDNELRELASKAHGRLDVLRGAIAEIASQADRVTEEWREGRNESSWQSTVGSAEKAYKVLQERLAGEGAGDPTAYGDLVQRRQIIESRLKEMADHKEQAAQLRKQADESLKELLEIRRELTGARRRFLEEVLGKNQYVKIEVDEYRARELVEAEFRRLVQKKGGGFEKDIGTPDGGGLLSQLYEGADDGGAIEENLAKIKNSIGQIYCQSDTGFVRDQRFANHIGNLPPEFIDRLDAWFPEDSLEVQYSASGNGQGFRSLHEGSPGQKSAALLAFLLSYGDEPLILDQPEDDLDNNLIYELIVTQLRAVKPHRQIIVVTHNANIVVNGDAELVVALEATRGETKKVCECSLQEKKAREEICSILEGGREAFEDRYRRIVRTEEPHV